MTGAAVDMEADRPGPQASGSPLAALAYLDVAVVVLALPIVLLAGGPLLGFGAGAGGWIVARAVGVAVDRYALGAPNPRTGLIVAIAGLFLRLWIVTLAIVIAARAGEDKDGLTAVIVVGVAFTIYLATSMILRPPSMRASGRRPESR